MAGRVEGKIAIVTGSSSGIGRAIAQLLAKEGATVICSDIQPTARLIIEDKPSEKPTHEIIQQTHGPKRAIFQSVDVSSSSSVQSLVERAVTEFGRLDVMINNAGIAPQVSTPIWEEKEESWNKIMEVNGKGVYLGCKFAAGQMIKQDPGVSGDRGWIVNLCSIVGLVGQAGALSYVASKHAVAGITKVVALDCAPFRVHCNAVCPGYTQTAMTAPIWAKGGREHFEALHPFRGLGTPEDIARAVLFLASEDNSWMTGVMMPVDGGYVAK